MFVSWEPEATNSPYGWKSRLQMLALWPISVRRTAEEESRDRGVRGKPGTRQRTTVVVAGACFHDNCTENQNSSDFQNREIHQPESYHHSTRPSCFCPER